MKIPFLHLLNLISPIWILLLASSCSENQLNKNWIVHEIPGRDSKHDLIYRVKAPKEWQIRRPELSEDLSDTKKALFELLIKSHENDIRITIHNFPSKTLEERIAPEAQIFRWKRQFEDLDQESVTITPQSFAGFIGLLFEATGKLNGASQTMICFCMQIADMHYRALKNEQKKADYTIKIVGSEEIIKEKRDEIVKFARSFELIDEIGSL